MPQEKKDAKDSVRKQWAMQRKGGLVGSGDAGSSTHGRHFAQPALSSSSDISKGRGAASVPSPMPVYPARQSSERCSVQQHRRIAGASGEMPAVPMRVTYSPALPYSRYNKRYLVSSGCVRIGLIAGLFSPSPSTEGILAYDWKPFLVGGLANALLSIVWGILVFSIASHPLSAGDAWMMAGVALLCIAVISNIGLAIVALLISLRNNSNLVKRDVVASVSVKFAFMMLVDGIVWVLSMALTTLVAA